MREPRGEGALVLRPAFTAGVRRLSAWQRWLDTGGAETAPATRLELSLERVEAIEDALRVRVSDELLALLSVGLKETIALPDLLGQRERWRERGLGSAWLPVRADASFVTPLRTRPGDGLQLASWSPEVRSVETPRSAPFWLERWLDHAMSAMELAPEVTEKIDEAGEGPLEVVLVAAPPPPPPPEQPPERVRHARFGPGTVKRRGGGKVEVAFDDGTARTLREDFVAPE
jgi:hypothetical protein